MWEAAKAAERKILLMQEISEEVIQQVLTADADDGTVNADNGAFVDTDARDQRWGYSAGTYRLVLLMELLMLMYELLKDYAANVAAGDATDADCWLTVRLGLMLMLKLMLLVGDNESRSELVRFAASLAFGSKWFGRPD